MAFDQATRNRLARFVNDARAILTEEFTRQLQHEYGLDPGSGEVTLIDRLTALDDTRRETARVLRETLEYYLAGNPGVDAKGRRDALDRILREQAFTVLNRLCALRMAEGRGLILESVAKGYQSKGFQLYARLARMALGETGDAYRCYLFSLFDEFAVDLPVLFDRFSPQGRLFPREAALLRLLQGINHPEIEPLWAEDETIGWIYQYFNSKEERKAMRDASQMPRNSRELAVRNQFFTPRYVVEFLVDNTLGRIWYEITRGETVLKNVCRYMVRRPTESFLNEDEEAPVQEQPADELSQEQLLRLPVYITHRPFKDPREFKMLDPACGSMHFGLYAFDLFERIYDEAWDMEEKLGTGAFARIAGQSPLRETYPTKEALLREVPRLIIENNVHGIDIDPRAVQIAGLSLWLRAQKSWQSQGLKSHERPEIRRSNIVCAEPMPGDRAQMEEFLATLREDHLESLIRKVLHVPAGQKVRATRAMAESLANLVRAIWREMELAGEAGSLLRIEETLREAIAKARAESEEKAPLFRVLEFSLNESPKEQNVEVIPSREQDFWNRAEALVAGALEEYSERAQNGSGFRRHLFAGDAAQGFAFIDLCRNKYDVVLMNPPFGAFSRASKGYVRRTYQHSSNDIFAAFIDCCMTRLETDGLFGAITSRTGFFVTSFTPWRRSVVTKHSHLVCFSDLGGGVMDGATVEAAAYVLCPSKEERNKRSAMTPFMRALGRQDKESFIAHSVNEIKEGHSNIAGVFWASLEQFQLLQDIPFVYWIRIDTLRKLTKWPSFEPIAAQVRKGLRTGDNFRFVRAWWEISPTGFTPRISDTDTPAKKRESRWVPLVLSGSSQPWFSPLVAVLNWKNNGRELRQYVTRFGSPSRLIQAEDYYFRAGMSWTLRAVRFVPYAIPAGCIPTGSRPMAFPENGKQYLTLAVSASRFASAFMRFYGDFFTRPKFLEGKLKLVPWAITNEDLISKLNELVRREVMLRRTAYQGHEPFFEFVKPFSLNHSQGSETVSIDFNSLLGKMIEQEVDQAYGLMQDEADEICLDLDEALAARAENRISSERNEDDENDDADDGAELVLDISKYSEFEALISYIVGCAVGRWDVRYYTGAKPVPALLDPFAALPMCPPGMPQNERGLPAEPTDLRADYPIRISWPGVLVDDEGHMENIFTRVREVSQVIWGEKAEVIEAEANETLGVSCLIEYIRKPSRFFADHLTRYSKCRRKAPIYWPLSTPSNSYTLWLYYHRLTNQTLFTCVNDFIDPKLKQIADEAAQLRQKKGRSIPEEKELERLTDFEHELSDFREELLRVAKFWKPNLNDGVEITAAPLWMLFQHKPWQKRLRETWRKLETGEYDWAHLAHSIWPDRVRKRCETDKSLAIAHGLDPLFVEPNRPLKRKPSRKQDEESEGDNNED